MSPQNTQPVGRGWAVRQAGASLPPRECSVRLLVTLPACKLSSLSTSAWAKGTYLPTGRARPDGWCAAVPRPQCRAQRRRCWLRACWWPRLAWRPVQEKKMRLEGSLWVFGRGDPRGPARGGPHGSASQRRQVAVLVRAAPDARLLLTSAHWIDSPFTGAGRWLGGGRAWVLGDHAGCTAGRCGRVSAGVASRPPSHRVGSLDPAPRQWCPAQRHDRRLRLRLFGPPDLPR